MSFNLGSLDRDPFDRIDRAMNRPFGGFGRPASPEYRQEFAPEEYEGLRSKLLGGAMSGLRGIGWALSTPGDYLRGAISGNFGGRKSGRDILDQLGVTSRGSKGWGAWGAGLAADIATDPLMLLGLGPGAATTRAGAALSRLAPLEGGIQGLSRAQKLQGMLATESGLKRASAFAGATPAEAAEFAGHVGRGGRVGPLQFARGQVATAAQEAQVARELGRPLRVAEPLASLARVQLPFGIGPRWNIGTGATAQKLAGGLDVAGDFLRYGNPLGKFVGSAFDRAAEGAGGALMQKAFGAPGAGTDVRKQFIARTLDAGERMRAVLEPLIRANPANERQYLQAAGLMATRAPAAHVPANIVQDILPLSDQLRSIYRDAIRQDWPRGIPTKEFQSKWGLDYLHRQALYGGEGGVLEKQYLTPVRGHMDIRRNQLFDVPGGEDRINQWAARGLLGKTFPLPVAAAKITRDMVKDLRDLTFRGVYTGPINLKLKAELYDQARKLAKAFRGMEEFAGPPGTGPVFAEDPIQNWLSYGMTQARKQGSARAIYGGIGEAAVPIGRADIKAGTHVPVDRLLRQAGLKTWLPPHAGAGLPQPFAPGVAGQIGPAGFGPATGALPEMLRELAPKGAPLLGDKFLRAVDPRTGLPTLGPMIAEARKLGVPIDQAKEILASYQRGLLPEQLKGPAGLVRSYTNLFRALAYPIWPASHVRNAATAAFNMLRTEGPLGAMKSVGEQWKAMRNPNFMDPALLEMRRLQRAHGGVYGGYGLGSETAGMNMAQRTQAGHRVTQPLAGSTTLGPEGVSPTGTAAGDMANLLLNEGLWGTAKNLFYKTPREIFRARGDVKGALSRNLGIRGMGGQLADTLPAVHAGWKFGENIEDLFRGAQMRGMMKQGYSPAEAGRQMLKYQFDYGPMGFTDIERNIMRQVFPFYGFMRKNVPLQLETLAARPGIIGAQVAPMMQDRTRGGDYIPQYLQGNISAPLGPPQDGRQRFIGTFGLPAEEAFGRLQFQGGLPSLGSSAMAFASNLNPLIKGGLESLTNRQFFSGRQLSDLKPGGLAQWLGQAVGGSENPDRDRMIAQVLMNSPLTRFKTSAERAFDERKPPWARALNLGTGVRVTDVDVEQQRAIETRDAILAAAAGMPHLGVHKTPYAQAQHRGQLTPTEVELMRMQATYEQNAAAHAEKRRREAMAGVR